MTNNSYSHILQSTFRFIGIFLFFSLLVAGRLFAGADMQPTVFYDSIDPVPADGKFNYIVTLGNNKATQASNVELNVSIPNGFSVTSIDNGSCSYNGAAPSTGAASDNVVCRFATFAGNSSVDINISAKAGSATGVFESTASVTSDVDDNLANNTETIRTTVVESGDLKLVSKTSIPNPIAAGGVLTYRFEVKNNGSYKVNGIKLVDELPNGLNFLSDNNATSADNDGLWDCSSIGQKVTCNASSLDVNSSNIFYFRVKVTATSTGDITNTATISATTPDPNSSDNTATNTVTIQYGTDMNITKTIDTNPAISDQNVTYRLVVGNSGPMVAQNVTVVDELPTGYTNIQPSATGWTCEVNGTKVTCNRDSNMSVGVSETISIIAQVPHLSAIVTHQNSATVSTITDDPISTNDTSTVTYDAYPDQADLGLTKTKSPTPIAVGDTATSIIKVKNLGPRPATSQIQVKDALSPNESYQSFSGTGWSCTHDGSATGGIVTCDYNGSLAMNETASDLTIKTTATGEGNMTNEACTGGTTPTLGGGASLEPSPYSDINTANDCSYGVATATSVANSADIVVTKTTSDTHVLTSENNVTYTINVRNDGNATAKSVDLTDTIPQYISAYNTRPATAIGVTTTQGSCSVTNALVKCALGDIVKGSDVNVTLVVQRPMLDGNRTNTASAYSTLTGDTNRTNNVSSVNVLVDPIADMEMVSKQVAYANKDANSSILAGTEATYTLQIRNNGPSSATDVNVSDLFSGEAFTFVSATADSGTCSYDTGTREVKCTMGTLPSEALRSITIKIRPDHNATVTGAWQIDNTASVTSSTFDSNTSNNRKDQNLTIVGGEVDLLIERLESPYSSEPVRFDPNATTKGIIIYQVDIKNVGPSLATNVTFTDVVNSVSPDVNQTLKFLYDTNNSNGSTSATTICTVPAPNPFTVSATSPKVNCSVGSLSAGETYTRYIVYQVNSTPDAISGDVYNGESNVTSNERETQIVNNIEPEKTTVRTIVDVNITKTSSKSNVEVGEKFFYTLVVTNAGPGESPQTTITDNLPSGMQLTATPTTTQGSCRGSAGSTSFTCNVDDNTSTLKPNQPVTITLPVVVVTRPSSGIVSNKATVTTVAPDTNTTNNSSESNVTVYEQIHIGDLVWEDLDADGVQDSGEPGISGVSVSLILDSNNSVIQTTTTDNNGTYRFDLNSSDTYHIRFTQPTGYRVTIPNSTVTTDLLDSDINSSLQTPAESLSYGENNTTFDAGFFRVAAIGDKVWIDADGDGIQDNNAAEVGVQGVRVKLYDANDTEVTKDIDGNLFGNVDTNASGEYLFDHLRPGIYYVGFTLPTGYKFTIKGVGGATDSDADLTTGKTAKTTLVSNETDKSWDAGIYVPVSIGDRVWLDANANGIQDATESGIADLNVTLYDSAGGQIATTTTNANGNYGFNSLLPGSYSVGFSLSDNNGTNYIVSPQVGVQSDANNSDINTTGFSVSTTLSSGESTLNIDAGLYKAVSIGDFVWYDSDMNGLQDIGEVGIKDVNVTLYKVEDNNSVTNKGIHQTTLSGIYHFTNLVPGSYYVKVQEPTGYRVTLQNSGSDDKDSDIDKQSYRTVTIVLRSPDDNMTLDAGFYKLGRITGSVTKDTNNDNIGDVNLSNVTITLKDLNGNTIMTTTTDIQGLYAFENVEPGSYIIVESQPVGLVNVSENEGGSDNDSGDSILNNQISVLLKSGESDTGNDFVEELGVSIGDRVWYDSNGDGIQDANETNTTGIGGIVVRLYLDGGRLVSSTHTQSDGTYLFENYSEGSYYVQFDLSTLSDHYGVTKLNQDSNESIDSDANLTTGITAVQSLSSGVINRTFDMGIYLLGTISGTIWVDKNKDGIGDTTLQGVKIVLYDDSGNIIATTLSGADGSYLFSDIPQGTYTIKEEQPEGYLNAGEREGDKPKDGVINSITVHVGVAEEDKKNDFIEEIGGSIGDYVWYDANANGLQDSTEKGQQGVHVCLEDSSGNAVRDGSGVAKCLDTNLSGYYLFDGLFPGDYVVVFSLPTDTTLTPIPQAGTDITIDSDPIESFNHIAKSPTVTLTLGNHIKSVDMGFVYLHSGSIGDYVWIDTNKDGILNEGERGLDNVLVRLYDAEGTLIKEMTTHDGGQYLFEHLPEGNYIVEFVSPEGGYVFSPNNRGDEGIDSDANQFTGRTTMISLREGEHIPVIDAGVNCGCDEVSVDSVDTFEKVSMLLMIFMTFLTVYLLAIKEEQRR